MDITLNSTRNGEPRFTHSHRLFAGLAMVLALGACSSDTSDNSGPPQAAAFEQEATEIDTVSFDGTVSLDGTSGELAGVEGPTAVAVIDAPVVTTNTSTTVAAPTTTDAPTTTTTVDLTVVGPNSIDGATAEAIEGLMVVTSVGDDLNVRTGPGVGNPVVVTLAHGTGELDVSHFVTLPSGAVWQHVLQDGVSIGWVNGAYLATPSPTAQCQKGGDFPVFEGAVTNATGDLDHDGLKDEVFVLAEPNQTNGYDAWLLVSFGNGGVATGAWTDWFDPTPIAAVHFTNLTANQAPGDFDEIVFQTGQGASHGQWGVMALDNCALVPTTLNSVPFSFSNGASAGHSTTGGCAYGAHGKVEFVVTSVNFNSGVWTVETFELTDTEWMSVGSFDHTDFPNTQFPHASNLNDCAGV